MPTVASPRRSLRRTCNIPRHGDVYERVSVHQGSVVAVGGGEVIEVKLLVLQSWMDASKPAGSYSFLRKARTPAPLGCSRAVCTGWHRHGTDIIVVVRFLGRGSILERGLAGFDGRCCIPNARVSIPGVPVSSCPYDVSELALEVELVNLVRCSLRVGSCVGCHILPIEPVCLRSRGTRRQSVK